MMRGVRAILSQSIVILLTYFCIGCGPSSPTPLQEAVIDADQRKVDHLLKSGVDPDERGPVGNTALHLARDPEIVRLLIASGASLDLQNTAGNTPLHIAAYLAQPEVVDLLVGAGADVNKKNSYGDLPLHMASTFMPPFGPDAHGFREDDDFLWSDPRRTEVAKILVDAGARVDARGSFQETALFKAADLGDAELMRFLLTVGADPSIGGRNGETVLAEIQKHPDIAPETMRLLAQELR